MVCTKVSAALAFLAYQITSVGVLAYHVPLLHAVLHADHPASALWSLISTELELTQLIEARAAAYWNQWTNKLLTLLLLMVTTSVQQSSNKHSHQYVRQFFASNVILLQKGVSRGPPHLGEEASAAVGLHTCIRL